MSNEIEDIEDLTHSDLSFLKELKKFSFDSKMLICQKFSSRIMSCLMIDIELMCQQNIMPWELEILTVFSVIYDTDDAILDIDERTFSEMITKIRNFRHPKLIIAEKDETYAEIFMMISILQQHPVQGSILQKLFRYHYFFNFKNKNINMKEKFKQEFGIDYSMLELFAFILFIVSSKDASKLMNENIRGKVLQRLFTINKVMDILSIDRLEYEKRIRGLYKSNVLDYYYGLKIQYQYPIITGKDYSYIPAPYLVINAVTESLLNRLTFGNKELRNNFGKEVVENYLLSIYREVSSVEWISSELIYKIGKQEYRTPDVLVGENGYCIFFDTKSITPSLKIRKFDRNEIEKIINIYAENVLQIFIQISNYLNGHYVLAKEYIKDNIFGVVVVLEDTNISRESIYSRVFEMLSSRNIIETQEIKDYIHSHIKVVPLRQIEEMIFQGSGYLPCLLNQVNNPQDWNNYTFYLQTQTPSSISSFRLYEIDIISEAVGFIYKASLELSK